MKQIKKGGRPRNSEVHRYKPDEKGMKIFNIEDLAAEMTLTLLPGRRGNLYVGTEFEDCEFVILVKRAKHDTENAQ